MGQSEGERVKGREKRGKDQKEKGKG